MEVDQSFDEEKSLLNNVEEGNAGEEEEGVEMKEVGTGKQGK